MPETLFKKTEYGLEHLLLEIEHGSIGLPELQRPFVWKAVKVRDLFDSMYQGFPVGYLLFWSNLGARGGKQIGGGQKQADVPLRLVVDGQQRLTSLYAVLRGRAVLDEKFKKRRIQIAFHPPGERFEVATAAHRKDPEWIDDISTVWREGAKSFGVVNRYLKKVREKREVGEKEEERLAGVIDRLYDLKNYPFTTMEIAHTVDEAQVAEIFVRINSKGVRLQQSDFILTLMSVFWEEGRRALEEFCRVATEPSVDGELGGYNAVYSPEPDQLLRVLIAVGLGRAVLSRVYGVLRGKDVEGEAFSDEAREGNFERLRETLPTVLDLTNWHEFIKCLQQAGYRHRNMITSQNAVVFAYALYLLGRGRHGLTVERLRPIISRWFFAAAVTARLSGSFETDMEALLRQLSEIQSAEGFIDAIEHDVALMVTEDFWTLRLPEDLATSAARSPALYGFEAALRVLDAPVLFSKLSINQLADPVVKTKKKALDRHHLFPKGYLKSHGFSRRREVNQIANQTFVEWPDNVKIGMKAPAEYVPAIAGKFDADQWEKMMRLHGLPGEWWTMEYSDFLIQRRRLMAGVIRRAFDGI